MSLPALLKPLFLNYVAETIDPRQHKKLIIKTVLARGTWDQVRWVLHHYGSAEVRQVFREDYFGLQSLPEPARRLWGLIFLGEGERSTPPEPGYRGKRS